MLTVCNIPLPSVASACDNHVDLASVFLSVFSWSSMLLKPSNDGAVLFSYCLISELCNIV